MIKGSPADRGSWWVWQEHTQGQDKDVLLQIQAQGDGSMFRVGEPPTDPGSERDDPGPTQEGLNSG